MSKFYTPLPVALAAAIAALPKGAFVHGVQFNEKEERVEVHWEHDGYSTGLDHAVEFKAEEFEEEPEPAPEQGEAGAQGEPAADAAPAEKSAEAPAGGEAKPGEPVKPAPAKPAAPKTATRKAAVRTAKAKAAAKPKA